MFYEYAVDKSAKETVYRLLIPNHLNHTKSGDGSLEKIGNFLHLRKSRSSRQRNKKVMNRSHVF